MTVGCNRGSIFLWSLIDNYPTNKSLEKIFQKPCTNLNLLTIGVFALEISLSLIKRLLQRLHHFFSFAEFQIGIGGCLFSKQKFEL